MKLKVKRIFWIIFFEIRITTEKTPIWFHTCTLPSLTLWNLESSGKVPPCAFLFLECDQTGWIYLLAIMITRYQSRASKVFRNKNLMWRKNDIFFCKITITYATHLLFLFYCVLNGARCASNNQTYSGTLLCVESKNCSKDQMVQKSKVTNLIWNWTRL